MNKLKSDRKNSITKRSNRNLSIISFFLQDERTGFLRKRL